VGTPLMEKHQNLQRATSRQVYITRSRKKQGKLRIREKPDLTTAMGCLRKDG